MGADLHSIVEQLSPNPEQQPAVKIRRRDVVVTAGAGTGKTRTLVARYLSLLAEGMERPREGPLRPSGIDSGHVRRIVAITFTRKAAREMRNRIRAEVQRYVAGPELSAEARERWQSIYAELDAARIGTIHSLCSEILRAHPAEADVDPRFQVLEEGQAGLLRREVLDATLAWTADDQQAVELFPLLGGARNLRDVVDTLLAQRLDAAAAFEAILGDRCESSPSDLLVAWQAVMRQRQRTRFIRLVRDRTFTEAVDTLRTSTPADPDDAIAVQRREVLEALDEADVAGINNEHWGREPTGGDQGHGAALGARLAALSRLGDVSLVGGSLRAWSAGREEKNAVKRALRTLRERWREDADFLSRELTELDARLAGALPSLRAVFRFAHDHLQAAKDAERALDFDDLEAGAVAVLENCPAVRARWQQEVDAILVDEFQDTNERQRDLVHLLTADVGRLFVVGDGKQSIYRFRGADVTVFREERDEIVDSGGAGLALSTSYRAHRGLVEALNALLKPVLGEETDPVRPWAEPFAPIEAYREEPAPGIEAPYVEFHLTLGSKGDGALDRAARALVGRLGEIVDGRARSCTSKESDREGGRDEGGRQEDGGCPLGYGDIAILCRASTSFSHYEDALDDSGVPYVTVAGRGFYERPEIRDLLNALRALADPTDDVALVGLLRSPAVALSDAAIYRLVQARGEAVVPLWDVLRQSEAVLGGGTEDRAARAVSMVRELHTMAGRTVVGDLLKAFLDATSYRAALLKAGQQRAVRNVDKLLTDAHGSGLVGVRAFLDYLEGLQESGAREGEARSAAGGGVQIMSVHQAKGLEFPIVVLGDTTWERGSRAPKVLIDPDLGVLLRLEDSDGDETAAVYSLAADREADQDASESDRLLYVAATRAREKLLVSGLLKGIKKDGTPHKLGGWLGQLGRPLGLDKIEIPYDDEGCVVHRRELRKGETRVDCQVYEPACTFYEPMVRPQVADASYGEEAMPPLLLNPVVEEGTATREPGQRVWRVVPETRHGERRVRAKAPARVVGHVVHEALAAWRLPDRADDEAFRHWLQARARAAGLVDGGQIAHVVRRSRRLLLRLRGHRLFEILDTAEQRLHEMPYSVEVNGRVESGQIDLVYRRDRTWTIVEFKTDEVRSRKELDQLLEDKGYMVQTRRYAAAAGRLLGARPTCLLCMLDDRAGIGLYVVPESGGVWPATL